MNKFVLIIISLFLFNTVSAQIQSGEIIYKARPISQNDEFEKEEELNSNAKSILEKTVERKNSMVVHLDYHLEFNKNEALFYYLDQMETDAGVDLASVAQFVGFYNAYYTNLNEDLNLNQFHSMNDELLLLQSKPSEIEWKIHEETKEILGYTCKKATAKTNFHNPNKSEVVVWFTPDIPFQFGPGKLAGLPGLILAVNRKRIYVYADKINLKEENTNIKRLEEGRQIDFDDYKEIIDKEVEQFLHKNR